VRHLVRLGFSILATRGTAVVIRKAGLDCELVSKVKEGRPNIVDRLVNGDVAMVINTTIGVDSIRDSYPIRRTTLLQRVPYFTTVYGAMAAAHAIEAARTGGFVLDPRSLQEYHQGPRYDPQDAPAEKLSGYRAPPT
jgi:carbamoyl-phosphate synthase large subunit